MEIYVNTLPTGIVYIANTQQLGYGPPIPRNIININYYQVFLINVKRFWPLMRGNMMQK